MTRTDNTHETDAVEAYRCPYCERATYQTEMLVRAHICWADDDAHADIDGTAPEVEPIELNANQEVIGRAFTLAGQLNLHALELSDIPAEFDGESFTERERRALLVCAFNANKGLPYPELQDRLTAHLEGHGFEPLSEQQVRQLCEQLFTPHMRRDAPDSRDITTARTALTDLTPLQQSIIVAHLCDPDLDPQTLSTSVGTAVSYPTQVLNARQDLIEGLRRRLGNGQDIESLLAERVPEAALSSIESEGYLDEFDIDLSIVRDRKQTFGITAGPSSDSRQETPVDTDPPAVEDETASPPDPDSSGQPKTPRSQASENGQQTTWSVEPTDPDALDLSNGGGALGSPEAASDCLDALTPERPDDTDDVPPQTSTEEGGSQSSDASVTVGEAPESIPRSDVVAVRRQVAFDLAVIEREMDLAEPTPQQARTKAYLEEILSALDEVL